MLWSKYRTRQLAHFVWNRMSLQYAKPKPISLRTHPEFNEKWVQRILAVDPSLLGLGDLVLKDQERIHPGAGRLDLLFQEIGEARRYEVELQLGRTDETHIIRTIEYWDIERKRYPQYEHTAVIVAEDITSRFLNVISLFNGFIPLVAIRMTALQLGDQVSLVFTKVLDQMPLGLVDEDEAVQEPTDRAYWENRSSRKILQMADTLLAYLKSLDHELALNYNKHYIGLTRNGRSDNFVTFGPRKSWMLLSLRLEKSEEVETAMEQAELEVTGYMRWGAYRLRLTPEDVERRGEIVKDLLTRAYEESRA